MYEDKILGCVECGEEFIFSAGNQQFFAERGLMYEPKRCKACRDAHKRAVLSSTKWFSAVCADCGNEVWLPRKPNPDSPVYCTECFVKRRDRET